MGSFLVILVGVVTIVLFLSFLLVLMHLPIAKTGWQIEGAVAQHPCAGMSEHPPESGPGDVVTEPKITSERPATDPRTVAAIDLFPGDSVCIETESGSKYAFIMKVPALGTYHLVGTSSSRGKYFDMDVIVDRDFVSGRHVTFWSLDRNWRAITTPVLRILVSHARIEAVAK